MKSEPVSPALVVPRVHAPAGLVSWVQAYRLFLREEGLHVIHLGRGWMGPEVVPNWFGNKIAKWLRSKIDAKLAVVDREIAGELPENLLGRGESFLVSIAEFGAVTCAIQEGCDRKLLIRSSAKKLTLFGLENAEVAFAQIAHYFERRGGRWGQRGYDANPFDVKLGVSGGRWSGSSRIRGQGECGQVGEDEVGEGRDFGGGD